MFHWMEREVLPCNLENDVIVLKPCSVCGNNNNNDNDNNNNNNNKQMLSRVNPLVGIVLLSKGSCKNKKLKSKGKCKIYIYWKYSSKSVTRKLQ